MEDKSNKYDKILKENIQEIFLQFAKYYFKIDIQSTEELKDKLQVTEQREADFLRKVVDSQGNTYILHIELQTKDEPNMLNRMQLYHALITHKYNLEVKQYVICLGENPSKMPNQLPPEKIFQGFDILDLISIDYENFANSTIPEEIILAILCDFKQENQDKVIEKIFLNLKKATEKSGLLGKYVTELLVLARLRKVDLLTQKITKNMVLDIIDVEKDSLFILGEVKGEKKAILKTAINLIKKGCDNNFIAEVTQLSIEEIEKLRKEVK